MAGGRAAPTSLTVTLTTTGRRTGEPRPVRLYAFPVGEDLVVVGSAGGAARDPHWVANLRADACVTVRLRRETYAARAREVDGPEHDRLWGTVAERFPLYVVYQRRTVRRIPLFVLEGIGEHGRAAASRAWGGGRGIER